MALPDRLALSYDPDWRALWSNRFGDPLLDAETFRLGADNILVEIGAQPKTAEEVEGQYMGLLRFTPDAWAEMTAMLDDLPADRRDKIDMTSALQAIITRGRVPIRAVAQRGPWGEVDSADDLTLYEGRPT